MKDELELKNESFNQIHDIAADLLNADLPDNLRKGLEQIVSIARYQHPLHGGDTKTTEDDR